MKPVDSDEAVARSESRRTVVPDMRDKHVEVARIEGPLSVRQISVALDEAYVELAARTDAANQTIGVCVPVAQGADGGGKAVPEGPRGGRRTHPLQRVERGRQVIAS
jgi:hypothetical protein